MNNLVVNTPGAAGQVKTAVGLWRFERKLDAATIRRTCERTHGKCGQRLPLDHRYFHTELLTASAILPCVAGKCGSLVWANFHAVLVLAEVALSSKKHRSRKARLSTDEGDIAQESIKC